MHAATVVCCAAGIVGLQARAAAQESALERAEAAVREVRAGDARSAAAIVRKAIETYPGDTLLHNLAASLLLMTGDADGALREWKVSLFDLPDDGLALYGAAMARLAMGDRTQAATGLQKAKRNGDRAYCLLAERYIELLNGATGGGGLALPDSFSAAVHAFSGLAAGRSGDARSAESELAAALAALPGDPFAEPAGLLMTFDAVRPLRFGSQRLPIGNGLAGDRGARQPPVRGIVTLSPGDLGGDIGFVTFRIDGAFSSIANTPPFRYVWDTSRFPNGLHSVEIIVSDRQGAVVSQAHRDIRTANPDAPAPRTAEGERADGLRAALWQMLMLRPSRAVLAYAAAQAARAAGDSAAAERYVQQTAAIDPNYRNARSQLIALDGTDADSALWRGSTADPVVALTFDDGPKPGITEQLLAILTRERVPATFFVIGRHVTEHPEILRKMADAGMEIENHSYTHPNLALLPPTAVERELLRTMASVESATGKRTVYFRPPGGNMNADTTRIAARWGLTPCLWTVDGEALENGSPQRLIGYVVGRAAPGAIILLHNGRMTTVEALPQIIAGIRKKGLGFVTVDGLVSKTAVAGRRPTGAGPGG